MPLIPLRCPQCGGEIQLDSTKEIGFCIYCGSKVVLKEALSQQVKIDDSHKIEAWVTLGNDALRSKNYTDAEQYANKIIEADLKNPDAWYIKGCCSTEENTAIDYWKRALDYSKENQPVETVIVEALSKPQSHFNTRKKTVTFIRGSAFSASGRHFHLSLNDKEIAALGNGETKSFYIKEGSYLLTGKIASYKMAVPLNVSKDMTVYINLNKRENKWDIVAN